MALLLVLTATTGLVDAVSVLGLGRVFTANMTGNVVFLGFAVAGVPEYSASRAVLALVAFLIGAVIGGWATRTSGGSPARHRSALWTEAALLLAGGALAALPGDVLGQSERQAALIVLTAVAMGVRNASIRRLAVPDMTTTVLTLTLTGLGADSPLAGGPGPRWPRRVLATTAMLGGAAVGALLVLHTGLTVPLLAAGALAAGVATAWPPVTAGE